MPYKQQRPLSSSIKVEQLNEPSSHPIRQKNLDRNYQPMADIEGGFYLREKRNAPQDNTHIQANVELDDWIGAMRIIPHNNGSS